LIVYYRLFKTRLVFGGERKATTGMKKDKEKIKEKETKEDKTKDDMIR
jgi:hypothetical protein